MLICHLCQQVDRKNAKSFCQSSGIFHFVQILILVKFFFSVFSQKNSKNNKSL